jgi:hypothetical protein
VQLRAYGKNALGKIMAGDMGTFVSNVFTQLQLKTGELLTEDLLRGIPPEKLKKLQADAREATKVFALLGERGFLFAAEVSSLEPPQGRVASRVRFDSAVGIGLLEGGAGRPYEGGV